MSRQYEYPHMNMAKIDEDEEDGDNKFVQIEAEILSTLANQDSKKIPDLILADNEFVGKVLRKSLEIGYSSAEILNFMPTVIAAHKRGISRNDIETQLQKTKKEGLSVTAIINDLEK